MTEGARRPLLGSLAMASVVAACATPPPAAPSPVILATPGTVCVGDDYRTKITLDGTQSTPMLALVPAPFDAKANPLTYLWTLTGSPYRVVSGSPTADEMVVEIAGEEPLQVQLTVTSTTASATITDTVSVTLVDGATCPLLDGGSDASDACTDGGDACTAGDSG